jgi:hypothetical protein
MMFEHVPHHGIPLGHMATGTVVHQDNAISEFTQSAGPTKCNTIRCAETTCTHPKLKPMRFLHVCTIKNKPTRLHIHASDYVQEAAL